MAPVDTGGAAFPAAGKRKPRLLVTTSTLPRWEGDPEPRFVLDLAKSVARQFDVTILAPAFPGAAQRACLEGVPVIRYRYLPLQRWENLAYPGGIMPRLRAAPLNWFMVPCLMVAQTWAVRRALRGDRYDLVHAHWLIPQGLLVATLSRRLHVPFMVTAHGGDVYIFNRGVFRHLLKFVVRRASAITAVSRELCGILAGLGDVSVRHLSMGVDVAKFSGARGGARPADLPATGPVIAFVGRLAEKKGIDVLLDAMARMSGTSSVAQVAIIGEGPLKSELTNRARDLGIADRVHFLGAMDHDAVAARLAAADVFVLPSVPGPDGDAEGLPVSLLEAAACRLPIIASDIGGVSEFLVDGENGILTPAGDEVALAEALELLLADEVKRERFASAARLSAEAFDWRVIGEQFAMLLEEMLSGD